MILKLTFVLLLSLGLAGCFGTTTRPDLVRTEFVVVEVPASLYNCPGIPGLPEAATLTDRQVSNLLIRLSRDNVTCRNSLNAIRQYLEQARTEIQSSNESRRN